ncbi:CLUMA_CG003542, isoform A [Clunio marinus]|uniref:CLUMA_CG003542, isoform A n=1 Tax=Clunio marinus TaxID=568069 RepID=A0A1J1HR04_9DIPT|nr:CLUMA_CG003542, isoform A [Clunio marinus]
MWKGNERNKILPHGLIFMSKMTKEKGKKLNKIKVVKRNMKKLGILDIVRVLRKEQQQYGFKTARKRMKICINARLMSTAALLHVPQRKKKKDLRSMKNAMCIKRKDEVNDLIRCNIKKHKFFMAMVASKIYSQQSLHHMMRRRRHVQVKTLTDEEYSMKNEF